MTGITNICVVGKKISGFGSDGTEAETEKSGLDMHLQIKPKSNKEREKLAARMRTLRGIPS
jgi:hypothetical protein